MNRRGFIGTLLALPFVMRLRPNAASRPVAVNLPPRNWIDMPEPVMRVQHHAGLDTHWIITTNLAEYHLHGVSGVVRMDPHRLQRIWFDGPDMERIDWRKDALPVVTKQRYL